jgi:glucose-6-phosphate isomerase
MRETSGAIFIDQGFVDVGGEMLRMLKRRASCSPTRRFRLCLHRRLSQAVQQMIIVHCRDSYSQPHRHRDMSVTYQMIEGEMMVLFFDDAGQVVRRIELAPPGTDKGFCFRLDDGGWYMPVAQSEHAVFLEILTGPNPDGRATEYAPWSPPPHQIAEVRQYLAGLGCLCDGGNR